MNAINPANLRQARLPMRGNCRTNCTIVVMAVLLASCVGAPPASENSDWLAQRDQLQQLQSWAFRGRVDVRYDNESHTPRIQWQQNGEEYQIRLWGTFNAGSTRIVGRPGTVTMENDGNVFEASSPEELILQQLGYELPVSYLEYWIKGLPAPDSRANLQFNALNQLTRIEQASWTVLYTDPRQYGDFLLPARMELTRPANDIRLQFFGLNWTVDEMSD